MGSPQMNFLDAECKVKGETAYLAFIPQSVDTEGDGLSITMGDAAVGFRYRD